MVLSAYADNVLIVAQNPSNVTGLETCQTVYSAAYSIWVKSTGRWATSHPHSMPSSGRHVCYSIIGFYLSATNPSLLVNWIDLEASLSDQLQEWMGLL